MAHSAVQKESQETQPVRDLDPNVRQRQAAHPDQSVWVSASAGTGKTKVLTDRVLRLMLPRDDGRPGTPAHKILGLTFTKAAANEMAQRINETLGKWAVLDEEKLQEALGTLLGHAPSEIQISSARRLFADVIDAPGGMKIMTIHSFCQSVLSRFPLEAELPPYFNVVEAGEATEILAQARQNILKKAEDEKTSETARSLQKIAETLNESQFFMLIRNMVAERHQFGALLKQHFGLEGLYTELCRALNIQPGKTSQELLLENVKDSALDIQGLRQACKALSEGGGKKEPSYAVQIQSWLDIPVQERAHNFQSYRSIFITTDNAPRTSGFPTQKTAAAHPGCEDILRAESQRLLALDETINAAAIAELTRDLLILGKEIIDEYQSLKTRQAKLDFDDLIFKTLTLLQKDGEAAWVFFKLDEGLDHILVDEAQDTNPEQWKIIDALCTEFFTGTQGETRTVFTVGDEKQSIYSFQRASPEEFSRMQHDFEAKIHQAGESWRNVNLNISFRSAQSILSAVDAVFENPDLRKGLSLEKIAHHSFRTGQAGRVELWPLFEIQKSEETDPWAPPVEIIETPSGSAQLAEHIAETIRQWLDGKEQLPSRGRVVEPGDIMILMRTRSTFVGQLSKALKAKNIPVSGVDRMVLGEQLAVQDLLAFARFALLPGDDLTLACALKSPLIGMDEEELYDLCFERPGTLWESIKNSGHKEISAYLENLIYLASDIHPYEFFSTLLQRPCPADERSGLRGIKKRLGDDAQDPLDEFLNICLNYERTHIPSLQQFLHWQNREEIEITREMDSSNNQVQIMTVHGAKGLQAPIVILPDTIRTSSHAPNQADRRLLWPDKTGLAFPLWSPRKNIECEVYTETMNNLDERAEEEYRRLLYVAITRAEDRLYVGGYTTLKKPMEHSWYNFIKSGLQSLPETEELEDGILRLENLQTRNPDRDSKKQERSQYGDTLPQWLFKNAPPEPDPPAPLVPSRPAEKEPQATSPLQSEHGYRFRRGNLTHKLLQILPELPKDEREKAAQDFITRYGTDLAPDIQEGIVKETFEILDHPEFAPLFGPGSFAEVPITGLMPDGRLISGQIDRLLVTDKDIWVIDYKTNRPPPTDPKDVPAVYLKQMQAYADTLREIYPARPIHKALLWTDGPYLMPLDTE